MRFFANHLNRFPSPTRKDYEVDIVGDKHNAANPLDMDGRQVIIEIDEGVFASKSWNRTADLLIHNADTLVDDVANDDGLDNDDNDQEDDDRKCATGDLPPTPPPADKSDEGHHMAFIRSQRGAPLMVQSGFVYRCERKTQYRTYWLCVGYKRFKCNARIICEGNRHVKRTLHVGHSPDTKRVSKRMLEYHSMEAPDRDEFLSSVHK